MKKRLLKTIVLHLFAAFTVVAAGANTSLAGVAEIRIGSRDDTHPYHRAQVYRLKTKGKEILCGNDSVPQHAIVVKGLKDLSPPFPAEPLSIVCARKISWTVSGGSRETRTACYVPGKNRVLDDILRWCSQF